MERTSRKIPVTERQFLWVQDDDKGEVTLHVGPTMVSPTAADRVVIDDGQGGFREDPNGRPQMMVELGDNQYAMLFNPLVESEGGPNGKFKQGRNEARAQRNGTRSMIAGPCSFYVRPGQRADVRDAHELASNQYLVVKVYGEVDKSAPYYEVTARSAAIRSATAENVREETPSATRAEALEPVPLKRGQLIVIRGLDTQFYIPPTGVDIVPDTSVDDSGAAINAATARAMLQQAQAAAAIEARNAGMRSEGGSDDLQMPSAELSESMPMDEDGASMAKGAPRRQVPNQFIDQSGRTRKSARAMAAPAAAGAPPQAPAMQAQEQMAQQMAAQVNLADSMGSDTIRKAIEKEARQARLIRRAVVLGEKEYCVIVDADGKRKIKVGPARVFPGPYDTFMTFGSRARVYDAYELLPQRALWLRVIAPISKVDLSAKLPRGFTLEKEDYFPGDELLLTGVSTFFFPFNEVEVLSPDTGQAVVGNDHGRVFIEAIGIDQKSGIYVRDLTTGEVRLMRGKQSYLVDPRKEVQVTRTVTPEDWNLWVASLEPHKVTNAPITTPWAVSVTVPNNTAVLVTSAASRRVVEGPCVTLLGYDETLSSVLLSTGTPKHDDNPLRTCFLRTVGNRVSDMIVVETSDFVKVSIRVSYSVTFTPENKEKWFNHENYIQTMVDHLRSIVRSRCRNVSLTHLWPQLPGVVRDTILGEKKETGPRPGRSFAENGVVVTEVEVLSAAIEDAKIAELMQRVQTESVTLVISDRKAQEALESAKLRAVIESQTQSLNEEARLRESKLSELMRKLAHDASLGQVRDAESVAREKQSLIDARELAALKARADREAQAKAAELKLLEEDARVRSETNRLLSTVNLETQAKLRDLEILLIQAQSAATVAERNAIQKSLVEAMTALGDKIMLADVAENMNLVSLFKGKDVGTILQEVLGGTKVMPTVNMLMEKFGPANGPNVVVPGQPQAPKK